MLYSYPAAGNQDSTLYASITYKKVAYPFTERTFNVDMKVGWPQYWDRVNRRIPLYRSSLAMSFDEFEYGYSVVILQPGDSALPKPSSLNVFVDLGTSRSKTDNYMKRLKSGEVLMNDYQTGNALVQKQCVHARDGESQTTNAWHGVPVEYFNPAGTGSSVRQPPVPYPTYGIQPGEICQKVRVVPRHQQMRVPNAGLLFSPDPVFIDTVRTMEPSVVTAAVAARNSGTLDILTEFVEFPQTLDFLTEQMRWLGDKTLGSHAEAKDLARGDPSKVTKALAKHWLQYRYAVMPIIYSIMDVSDTLREMRKLYAEFKEHSSFESTLPTVPGRTLAFSGDSFVDHRCYIRARYSPDTIVKELWRLTQFNLAATAWEITPWSFVADWVINFGDYITATTGYDDSDDSKCCYSWRDRRQYTVGYPDGAVSVNGLKTTVTLNTYTRQVINPSDHIGLSLTFDMGWRRWLDAAALSIAPTLKGLRSLR